MSAFKEIKIVGIDDERPPRIRKEAYIDLFYKLNEKAPAAWCEDFNNLGRKVNPTAKIDKSTGTCIETYVNNMDNIAPHFEQIRQVLADCNEQYMEKLRQQAAALLASNSELREQGGEQHRLNEIIASLEFDSPD
ncbi:MAG: hypothetical protein OEO19_17950 [Gammaproteobacteria bacterium]|nr:hypothetical protein [Gammaproteobacteria bacterium]